MKAAVRCNALTTAALRAQERHGKRLDASSKSRRVRDVAPIVGGGLNLSELLDAHREGTKQNAGASKVALHFIVRFPPEILTDEAPSPYQGKNKEERLRLMAKQAVKFINEAHGGKAVFAVRVDRDEAGETIADVFACPKYTKTTKKAETEWTSLTKFGKELAVKHQAEVQRRSKHYEGTKPITSPRAIGMSLQSEFAEFFQRVNGQPLTAKSEKNRPERDRLEVEEWRLRRTQEEADEVRKSAEAEAESIKKEAHEEQEKFRKDARAWVEREHAEQAEKKDAADADRAAAATALTQANIVLERLKETYQAVRAALPRIRRILTWDLATEAEKRQAKEDRKEAVRVAPLLRRIVKQHAAASPPPTEKPAPETDREGFEISP